MAEQGLPQEEWGGGGGDDGGANGGGFGGAMASTPFPGAAALMDVPAGCILVPAPGQCYAAPCALVLVKDSYHTVPYRSITFASSNGTASVDLHLLFDCHCLSKSQGGKATLLGG